MRFALVGIAGRDRRVCREQIVEQIVAETLNGLFYRNSVNYALPAMECPGIRDLVGEGDVLRLEIATGIVENLTRNERRAGTKMPEFLLAIVRSGGIMERLRADGDF